MKKTSRLLLSSCLLAALSAGCASTTQQPVPADQQATSAESFEERHGLVNRTEVFAIVESHDAAISLERKAARWGYGLKKKEDLSNVGYQMLTFDCPPGIDPHVAAVELEAMESFVTVEVNHKYTLQSTESQPLFSKPRSYADALVGWPKQGCEGRVPIGIIDGAIAMDSDTLRDATIINRSFLSARQTPADSKHGTAIAEILVGQGRLNNTMLYSASVMAEDEDGIQYAGIGPLLKAIDWQVKSGAKIINISLAGPPNKTLERVINRATQQGTIIVAAVGNAGPDSKPLYPAAFDNVIAATAVDQDATVYEDAVHGAHVDYAAPGVDVYVGNDENGRYVSGTSIATPFIVARLASDDLVTKSSTLNTMKIALSISAKDLGEKGRDPVYGAGLISLKQSCG